MTLAKEVISAFYIYVDGADLENLAPALRSRIEAFVAEYAGRVRVVDQRAAGAPSHSDLPDWDFGVNFDTEALTDAEKKDLLLFFQSLSAEFGCDSILGGVLPHGLTDDFVSVSADESLEPAVKLLTANGKMG